MQEPTFTITELVYGPMGTTVDPIDRAIMIAEQITELAEAQGRMADLEHSLAEITEERDSALEELKEAKEEGKAKEALTRLVEALDGLGVARYGKAGKTKAARVGDLVIVSQSEAITDLLGEALKEAREAIA